MDVVPTTMISGNADVFDDATAAASAKKDNILERLNKRNKERQNYFDVQLEQRQKDNLQLEGVDYFAHSFTERVRSIETRIENISEAAAKKSSGDAPLPIAADLTRLFAELTVDIQELQRYLTTSTMFLTDFKIKACQNVLNELSANFEETRLRLIPKKKFGFSAKKVATKPVVILKPKASANLEEKLAHAQFTWTLANRTDEHICLQGDEVNGQDITISNLRNCLVELKGHAGSVQISNAIDCIFLFGPISRSLFAEYCQSCRMAVACQQLRLHSSTDCRLYLHVTCRAIIEDSKSIEIANYNYDYATIESDFQNAGLDKTQNNYADVADFNWLSPDVASPNWKLVKDCENDWSELRGKFKEKSTNNAAL